MGVRSVIMVAVPASRSSRSARSLCDARVVETALWACRRAGRDMSRVVAASRDIASLSRITAITPVALAILSQSTVSLSRSLTCQNIRNLAYVSSLVQLVFVFLRWRPMYPTTTRPVRPPVSS